MQRDKKVSHLPRHSHSEWE